MKVLRGGEVTINFNDDGDVEEVHVTNFHFDAEGLNSRKGVELAIHKLINNAMRRHLNKEIKKLG